MIKLTSLEDMVIDFLTKSFGRKSIKVVVYPENSDDTLLDFITYHYKFTVSKDKEGLNVDDNGDVYLIPNIFPENYSEVIFNVINHFKHIICIINSMSFDPQYYELLNYKQEINGDLKATVYEFKKL